MAAKHKDEERVFRAALKLTNLTERAAYLRDACGNDIALLRRVQALLRAHDGAGDFLEAPALDVGITLGDLLKQLVMANDGPRALL